MLGVLYQEYANVYIKDLKDDDSGVGLAIAQEKFFPYVFLELNVEVKDK